MSASWTCKDFMWEPLVRETEKLTAKVHASKRKICHMSSKRNFAIHEELIKPHLINNIDGPITEGEEVIAVGANSVVITQGIKKTIKALVADLKLIFTEVKESEQADNKAVNVDNNNGVCRMGVVILGEGKRKTVSLYVLESMQFYRDGDYISHNSTSDSEKMTDEYENYKLVSVDRVVTNVRDSVNIMEDANDKLMEQLMAGADSTRLGIIWHTLANLILRVRYINKFCIFSSPRPPEVADLEDKVNFKEGVCYLLK
ncbi:hypothetical protein QQ045_001856 [Rhodiola kirilowii]